MAIPRKHTDWDKRRDELMRNYGWSTWERTPSQVSDQLRREQEDEKAYNVSLPGPTGRPTSARERKQQRSAQTTASKRKPRPQRGKKNPDATKSGKRK